MSKRDIGLYFVDIFIASSKICRYGEKFNNAQELLYDEVYWDATIRELQIIGEATNQLIKLDSIDSSYRDVVDFRNMIVHAYFGISAEMVWDIIQNHLTLFTSELLVIITENKINIFDAINYSQQEQELIKNVKVYQYLESLKNKIVKYDI